MKIGLIGINSMQDEKHFIRIKNVLQNHLTVIFAPNINDIGPVSKAHKIEFCNSTSQLFSSVDAVYFAKSLKTNFEFALNALKNSCHIFIEDISELSYDEIKQLYKLAFEASVKVQIKLSKAFSPEYLKVKDLILNPQLIEIEHKYSEFIRKKDYYYEILNNLYFSSLKLKSSVKKISTKAIPFDINHHSLVHVYISFDNGTIVNLKFNNLADENENLTIFFETDKSTQIDFVKHFAFQLQAQNGNIKRTEFSTEKETAESIEMMNFLNACNNFDPQSISEYPNELKLIQATEEIINQIKQA